MILVFKRFKFSTHKEKTKSLWNLKKYFQVRSVNKKLKEMTIIKILSVLEDQFKEGSNEKQLL